MTLANISCMYSQASIFYGAKEGYVLFCTSPTALVIFHVNSSKGKKCFLSVC